MSLLFSCLSVFGLVGNSMAIAVLQKDKERREALFLLQMLAVADLFYLALALLRYPLKYLLPQQETYVSIQVIIPLYFQQFLINSSQWMHSLAMVDNKTSNSYIPGNFVTIVSN